MDYKPSKIENIIRSHIQHYNEKRYWRMRDKVISFKGGKIKKAICMLYLFYIKRCDAFNNASLETMLGSGAAFATIPNLPHGLNGIIIAGGSHDRKQLYNISSGNNRKQWKRSSRNWQ